MTSERQQRRERSKLFVQILLVVNMVTLSAVSTWENWKQNPNQAIQSLAVTFVLVAAAGSFAGLTIYTIMSRFFDKK